MPWTCSCRGVTESLFLSRPRGARFHCEINREASGGYGAWWRTRTGAGTNTSPLWPAGLLDPDQPRVDSWLRAIWSVQPSAVSLRYLSLQGLSIGQFCRQMHWLWSSLCWECFQLEDLELWIYFLKGREKGGYSLAVERLQSEQLLAA